MRSAIDPDWHNLSHINLVCFSEVNNEKDEHIKASYNEKLAAIWLCSHDFLNHSFLYLWEWKSIFHGTMRKIILVWLSLVVGANFLNSFASDTCPWVKLQFFNFYNSNFELKGWRIGKQMSKFLWKWICRMRCSMFWFELPNWMW